MKNYVQPGNTITLTAPYAVASGDGLLVGAKEAHRLYPFDEISRALQHHVRRPVVALQKEREHP